MLFLSPASVGHHGGKKSVADAAFERPQGLLAGLALGDFLVAISAPFAVTVAHLGHGRHVQGVVQLAAPPHGQAVDLLSARGNFYGGTAVVGGEVVPVGEPAHVPGEADGDGVHYRPDAEDLGRGGPRGHHYGRQPLLELGQLAVQAAEVAQQFLGQFLAGGRDGTGRPERLEQPLYLAGVDLAA